MHISGYEKPCFGKSFYYLARLLAAHPPPATLHRQPRLCPCSGQQRLHPSSSHPHPHTLSVPPSSLWRIVDLLPLTTNHRPKHTQAASVYAITQTGRSLWYGTRHALSGSSIHPHQQPYALTARLPLARHDASTRKSDHTDEAKSPAPPLTRIQQRSPATLPRTSLLISRRTPFTKPTDFLPLRRPSSNTTPKLYSILKAPAKLGVPSTSDLWVLVRPSSQSCPTSTQVSSLGLVVSPSPRSSSSNHSSNSSNHSNRRRFRNNLGHNNHNNSLFPRTLCRM